MKYMIENLNSEIPPLQEKTKHLICRMKVREVGKNVISRDVYGIKPKKILQPPRCEGYCIRESSYSPEIRTKEPNCVNWLDVSL